MLKKGQLCRLNTSVIGETLTEDFNKGELLLLLEDEDLNDRYHAVRCLSVKKGVEYFAKQFLDIIQ